MRTITQAAATTLAVIAIACGTISIAAAAGYTPGTYTAANADTQTHVITRGAPIRVGPKVYAHVNGGHAAVGITRIWLKNGCDLVVETDAQPGERVISAIVDEDEALSRQQVQAGLSGGLVRNDIRLYKAGRHICANDRRLGWRSNLWVSITTLAPTA